MKIGGIIQAHVVDNINATKWGYYKIDSTLGNGGVEGVTGARRIALYELKTLQLVQKKWSESNGDYNFLYTKGPGTDYYAVALDHTDTWNLAGAYKIPQVLM